MLGELRGQGEGGGVGGISDRTHGEKNQEEALMRHHKSGWKCQPGRGEGRGAGVHPETGGPGTTAVS